MKRVLLLMVIMFWQLVPAQEHATELKWLTDFEQAKTIAQKEHKPIVMLFTGSDWCPPCRAMHQDLFPNKNFEKLAQQVVLVMVDFPRRKPMSTEQRMKNQALARQYHQGGVPTFVAVSPDGKKVLGKISGYRFGAPERDLDFFKKIIAANKS